MEKQPISKAEYLKMTYQDRIAYNWLKFDLQAIKIE